VNIGVKSISTVALKAKTGTFSEQNDRISPILENASLNTFPDDDDETPLKYGKSEY